MAIGNFLTTEEAADFLKISPGRVRQFMSDGRLKPDTVIGNAALFDREKLEKFAEIPRKTGRPKSDKNTA